MKASPRKNIRSVLAAVFVVVALAGLACGTAATATPSGKATPAPRATSVPAAVATATPRPTAAPRVAERTLRVGLQGISAPPDPIKASWDIFRTGISETLFKLSSKDLKPEPWLATGAQKLDEKTWEITLRPGVKFHNGALMDAAAVKASLERAMAKSLRVKPLLDIARVEVKDVLTLTIATNTPSPILPALLTEPASAIVDAAAAEAMGDAFTERPVLTGPFKVERFQLDKELVAVRHTEYWGSPPLVDRVIFTAIPDANARVLALQSRDIDMANLIPSQSVATVQKDPKLVVRFTPPMILHYFILNHRREPWKDAGVQQAIALAIEREALVKAMWHGQAASATGPFPPAALRCPQLQGYPFDPAKARQLLAQAGYQDKDGDGYVEKDGQTLAMTVVNASDLAEATPMAEAVQAMLKAIGIKVQLGVVEFPVLRQGNWDGALNWTNMGLHGDPHATLADRFRTGGSFNLGGFSSRQVDELIQQAGRASERQAREQFACAASQAIVDEVAVVPLVHQKVLYGASREVVGFDEPHPFHIYFIDGNIGKR